MKRRGLVIAIDGPAGAGKSTVAALVATRAELRILDTGAMYRVVALAALGKGYCAENVSELTELAHEIEIGFDEAGATLNGDIVEGAIRTLEIGQLASAISAIPDVRRCLVAQQQRIIADGGYVLEGRDVTSVVAPNADLKVFLTASSEERARRRWIQTGQQIPLAVVLKDVVERDHRDYTRADSPLTLVEDAVIIESFGLTPEQVAERIVVLLR